MHIEERMHTNLARVQQIRGSPLDAVIFSAQRNTSHTTAQHLPLSECVLKPRVVQTRLFHEQVNEVILSVLRPKLYITDSSLTFSMSPLAVETGNVLKPAARKLTS